MLREVEYPSILVACFALFALGVSGCTKMVVEPPANQYVSYQKKAQVAPGVVRYCWEEPIVEFEENGPGLDGDGHWYHPSYLAVRQVRSGKWRPCGPYPDEVAGETRNER